MNLVRGAVSDWNMCLSKFTNVQIIFSAFPCSAAASQIRKWLVEAHRQAEHPDSPAAHILPVSHRLFRLVVHKYSHLQGAPRVTVPLPCSNYEKTFVPGCCSRE